MSDWLFKRIRAHLPLLLLIVPVPISAQTERQRNVEDEWLHPHEARPRGSMLLRTEMLAAHNRARLAAGVPSLAWSAALSAEALAYARILARNRIFRHSDKASRSAPQGENLWMGSRGAFTYAEMAASWINERRYYRPRGALPDISTTGQWQDVGHYTQAIWRTTTMIGCGFASSDSDDYLVCRYTPPGNIYGRNATALER